MKLLQVKVEEEQWDALAVAAIKRGKRVSHLVREVIAAWLEAQEQQVDYGTKKFEIKGKAKEPPRQEGGSGSRPVVTKGSPMMGAYTR